MTNQKRVAAVHDISCLGKCSLTVALPIISAAGIEVSVVPTAILSTHTGGFTGYTYRDLSDDILPIISHWQSLQLSFNAIYTGYLGSFEQLDIVSELFDRLKSSDTLIVVDPVMADHGKLYSSFSDDFPAGMKKLIGKADVIVPNMTEAAFLLDEPYREGPYSEEYIKDILQRLAALGPKQIILTGVHIDDSQLGAACYDSTDQSLDYVLSSRIDGYYHGTGDIFASALVSGLVTGFKLSRAIRIAVDFTAGSIARTQLVGADPRFGVNFEAGLHEFSKCFNSD